MVVLRYVLFLASCFIELIMVPAMCTTGRVTSCIECLPQPAVLHKFLVIPLPREFTFSFRISPYAHLHTRHHRPMTVSKISPFLNFTVTRSEKIVKRSFVLLFFTGNNAGILAPRNSSKSLSSWLICESRTYAYVMTVPDCPAAQCAQPLRYPLTHCPRHSFHQSSVFFANGMGQRQDPVSARKIQSRCSLLVYVYCLLLCYATFSWALLILQ